MRVMSISQVSRSLGTFDTIIMMGANFGLFGGFEKARRLRTSSLDKLCILLSLLSVLSCNGLSTPSPPRAWALTVIAAALSLPTLPSKLTVTAISPDGTVLLGFF